MKIQAVRYHDISCGHRVVGHESKCRHLHGHNYRIWFYCEADQLDSVGRVIDFSEIKSRLCMWLEYEWDHKFLAWEQDPVMTSIVDEAEEEASGLLLDSVVWCPFNPTAENMAEHLLNTVGPFQLRETGIRLVKVVVEETRKCSASAELP